MAQNDLYNEETISQAINTKWAGKTVHFAKETDSTNSWIKRLAKERCRAWNTGSRRISVSRQRPF